MSDTRESDWATEMPADEFNEALAEMNEAFASTLERNVEAQAAFVETMTDAFLGGVPDEDELAGGFEGYVNVSEVWLDAADRTFEETTAAIEENDIDPETFRDRLQEQVRAAGQDRSGETGTTAAGELDDATVEALLTEARGLREVAERLEETV